MHLIRMMLFQRLTKWCHNQPEVPDLVVPWEDEESDVEAEAEADKMKMKNYWFVLELHVEFCGPVDTPWQQKNARVS